MQRTIPTLFVTAAALLPVSQTWAATHPATGTSGAAHAAAKPTSKKVTTHSYTGPVEDMQWGPVQVKVTIKNKKIVDVQASAPMERSRSQFINSQALPMLRQEVLHAQSTNIDAIGGATMTSEAYYYSLQAALKAAHKAHAF